MDENYIKKMYLGNFDATDEEKKLCELAKEYHMETENYDKKVCSCVDERGVAMPGSNEELIMINRNARAVRNRIYFKARQCGLSNEQMQKAISKYV